MGKKKATGQNGRGRDELPEKLKFDYIKSNFFRVVHADGIWGGISPNGHVIMAFWSERPPIPTRIVHGVTPDGRLGDELKDERESRESLVREVEVSVVMDLRTAKAFQAWLQERITTLEAQSGQESGGTTNG